MVEQFGLELSPIRVLVASDMASEGINLHRQCHNLIHFDLPWSLIRLQQRNGRIDRYGQPHTPSIYALALDPRRCGTGQRHNRASPGWSARSRPRTRRSAAPTR